MYILPRNILGLLIFLGSLTVRAGDMEVMGSIERLLLVHWKLEAKREIPSFAVKESEAELGRQKMKAANELVKASGGKLDTNKVFKLLEPTSAGAAPDWEPFKGLFNHPEDYFVESYLESATEFGKSFERQVVSGEVGRIQKREVREVVIQDSIEKVEIYRLSPRATTYAGVRDGTKKAGSLIKPGLIVLEDREIKSMATTPWAFRERLARQFGTNYVRAEEETVYRIKQGLDVTGTLNALLTWRQMLRTTMSINEEATEAWIINQSAYRSRLMKDADFMEAIKGLEQRISVKESLSFLSAFGAMGCSDIPLFILADTLQRVQSKKEIVGSGRAYQEIVNLESFAPYIKQQTKDNPAIQIQREEENPYVIFSQIGRLNNEELRKLFRSFYENLKLSWELDGIALRSLNRKFDPEYLNRIEKKSEKLAEQSLTVLAKLGGVYYLNDNDDKALELFRELYRRMQGVESCDGEYERLVLARSLKDYANIEGERGDLQLSHTIYEKVFKINKNYSVAYFHYSRLLVRMGDLAGALKAVDACLKIEGMKSVELRNNDLVKEAAGLKERLLKVLTK